MSHSSPHEVEVLYHDKKGYVVRCTNCQCYQIAFGTIALDQRPNEFSDFTQLIDRTLKQYSAVNSERHKEIYLSTPYPGIRLLFSYNELFELHEMLQKVSLILEAESIVNS